MNQAQYQTQAEEVINDLKEFYVFLERTEKLEVLMNQQRSFLLKQAKLQAESLEDKGSANQHMKSTLISVMEMSDEEVMESLMKNLFNLWIDSEGKCLDALIN
ncbi:hypothetical protein [Lysinibacillus xylanilyticus]|uniref:hypothetical protein n=1 Tax=Lysinibacillus xylanilyticus TaxID=582475 RepID=UPI003D0378A7